jgi:small subunit ribosomal protein S17e
MGKIRTKTTKRAARQVVEKHFSRLGKDYYVNKRVILDVTLGNSKKLKNKIAGYATHLMKRLARGPVRGISLKMQEEEREKRLDFVPEVPWMDQKVQDGIVVDSVTQRMLKRMETGVPRAVRLSGGDARVRGAAKGKRAAPAGKRAVKK